MDQQPNWLRMVQQGNTTSSTQQVKCVGNTVVFCFGFYFMSPKWTKTKIVIKITLLLHSYSCLPLVEAGYGVWRINPEVLIEIGHVLIAHGNQNSFQHHLHFDYLGHENVKQFILVEVMWHVQTAC